MAVYVHFLVAPPKESYNWLPASVRSRELLFLQDARDVEAWGCIADSPLYYEYILPL